MVASVTKNKSSVFILPMIIGVPYKYFNGFVNCYIGSNHEDEDDRRIYLVFDTEYLNSDNGDAPKGRVKVLESNSQYLRTVLIDRFSMMVFKPLPAFENDFDHFRHGRYSKFSKKYKSILRMIYNNKKVRSILNPSIEDRQELSEKLGCSLPDNCEIFDIMDEAEETFSLAAFLEVDI